jgi:hypothetical protein
VELKLVMGSHVNHLLFMNKNAVKYMVAQRVVERLWEIRTLLRMGSIPKKSLRSGNS